MASAIVDTTGDLDQRFRLLGIDGSKKREDTLQNVFKGSDFTLFKVVKDLGYWGWTPSGPYKNLEEVTAGEILEQLNVHQTPDELISIPLIKRTLPKTFASLLPQEHTNKYPYAAPILVGLHVASKMRGVDFNTDVDFLFGGSTLQMLAHHLIEPGYQYLVTRVQCHLRELLDRVRAGLQFGGLSI